MEWLYKNFHRPLRDHSMIYCDILRMDTNLLYCLIYIVYIVYTNTLASFHTTYFSTHKLSIYGINYSVQRHFYCFF